MNRSGYLELIIGPMFSGKTSTLLDHYRKYKVYNQKVCVINYNGDNRYCESGMSTHDRIIIECYMTNTLKSVVENHVDDYDVFLINEGQFFKDIYKTVHYLVEIKKKTVHIAALDGNFRRKPMGDILKLIPLSDKVEKKHAICTSCNDGTIAHFSKRITNNKNEILISTNDYIAVCRKCYQT